MCNDAETATDFNYFHFLDTAATQPESGYEGGQEQ